MTYTDWMMGDWMIRTMSSVKEAARAIIDKLPEHATRDDLLYELYVKQRIDSGLPSSGTDKRKRHHSGER